MTNEPIKPQPEPNGALTAAQQALKNNSKTGFFRAIGEVMRPKAKQIARRLRSPLGGTEDLIQDASQRAIRVQSDWNPSKGYLRNFLFKCLRWAMIDVDRHESGRIPGTAETNSTSAEHPVERRPNRRPEPIFDAEKFAGASPTFSAIDAIALKEALSQLETNLPNAFRVIQYRYQQEPLSLAETAAEMGLGVKAVTALEQHALQFLRGRLS